MGGERADAAWQHRVSSRWPRAASWSLPSHSKAKGRYIACSALAEATKCHQRKYGYILYCAKQKHIQPEQGKPRAGMNSIP